MSGDVSPDGVGSIEAAAFGRYLVGREPTAELRARYLEACRVLFAETPPDGALWLARRSPWTIGPLDAAAALIRPESPLRKRLLTMAAVLEASPAHADEFLPRPMGAWALAGTALRVAWGCAWKLAIGAPLLAWAGRLDGRHGR